MSAKAPSPNLFAITWPIFVENLLMTIIGTIGLWLAGHVSDGAVAIFGLSNQLRGIFDRIFRVVGIGTSVVVTQHLGGGDVEGAKAVSRAGLAASVWTGLAITALVSILPHQVLQILHLPKELFSEAEPFIVIIGIALTLDSVTITMFSVLRAHTFTQDSMRLVMAMNALQVLASAPLVFGLAGLPALGLMGLGWGLLISRLVVLILLTFMWARRLDIRLSVLDAFALRKGPLSGILHIGLPSAGEKIAFRVCFLMTVAMAGSMGASALATHAYAMQASSLITMYMVALGFGSEILLGHKVGSGDLHGANALLRQTLRIALVITMVAAAASCFIAPAVINLLSHNPQIVALITTIALLELALEPGRCLNVVVMGGLRSSGDARFPVKVSVLSNVIFGAGLAWLLGIHFKLGLPGIWMGYIADEWARGIAMTWRWYSLGWTTEARRARWRILHKAATSGRPALKQI